jgi:hypothetical protein
MELWLAEALICISGALLVGAVVVKVFDCCNGDKDKDNGKKTY